MKRELHLFQIDIIIKLISSPNPPIVRVWAKNESDAIRIAKDYHSEEGSISYTWNGYDIMITEELEWGNFTIKEIDGLYPIIE